VNPLVPGGSYWDQWMASLAWWAASDARFAILSLLSSFGTSTEPDFAAVAPVYNRMLAVALLLLGAVVAFGLIERVAGGAQGVGWAVIGRVIGATFFAYIGLGVVQYAAGYAALLATTWAPDLLALSNAMSASAGSISAYGSAPTGHHVSVLGLVLTALFLTLMALLVYLELIVRSALILTVTVFVPLVCALTVWPRMASSAAHLAEFLVGLLLAKFVVATALYVGLHLVVPALIKGHADSGGADWMESGVAVLLIAAFSPVALFQGIRFAHSAAGTTARDLGGAIVGMTPGPAVAKFGRNLLSQPRTRTAAAQLWSSAKSGVGRLRRP
jgi:hypothetical protein